MLHQAEEQTAIFVGESVYIRCQPPRRTYRFAIEKANCDVSVSDVDR